MYISFLTSLPLNIQFKYIIYYDNHLREYPRCNCGYYREDAEHFFFQCRLYSVQRRVLFTDTRQFHPLSVRKLLYGIDTNSVENNSSLFNFVQKYI